MIEKIVYIFLRIMYDNKNQYEKVDIRMHTFSEKIYLELNMPTEEIPVSDERRLRLALETLGYEQVTIPLQTLRKLYPLCRDSGFDVTVTLVYRQTDWLMTDVEPGDEAILIGRDGDAVITADDLGDWSGTISYEVLLAATERVHRRWLNDCDE